MTIIKEEDAKAGAGIVLGCGRGDGIDDDVDRLAATGHQYINGRT